VVGCDERVGLDNPSWGSITSTLTSAVPGVLFRVLIVFGGQAISMLDVVLEASLGLGVEFDISSIGSMLAAG